MSDLVPGNILHKLCQTPALRKAAFAILVLAAAMSASVAVKEALAGGIDFQWSAAHLLDAGRDPWKAYLTGDKGHDIILGQQPNYLPELYELLMPLGAMPFSHALAWWCGLNLLMLALTLIMVASLFHLDRLQTSLSGLLLLCATPFRVTMANGQHGIFILFLVTLLYYLSYSVFKGFALGLSYSKYSFSPLFLFVTLLRRRWSVFFWSLVPPLTGLAIAWAILRGNILTLAIEPIRTSKIAMGPGHADVMTTVELCLRYIHLSSNLVYLLPTVLGLGLAAASAFAISRLNCRAESEYALVIVFTLLCFKHGLYDYVVLIVPLAQLLAAVPSKARLLGLLAIGHFWFASSVWNRLGLRLDTSLLNLTVLCVLCFSVVSAVRTSIEGPDAPGESSTKVAGELQPALF